MDSAKVTAVLNRAILRFLFDVWLFVDLANLYRRFINRFLSIL